MSLLDQSEIASRLDHLTDWSYDGARLTRTLEFADFAAAFSFMTRVAFAAERLDHHPDWSNSWNRVEIAVTSHQFGGVTAACLDLVTAIDAAAVDRAACD